MQDDFLFVSKHHPFGVAKKSNNQLTYHQIHDKIARKYQSKYLMTKPYCNFLRLPQVKQTTGLSKSTIYARIADGTFPKQIPLGTRLVVWVESDIQNWIAEQVAAARG